MITIRKSEFRPQNNIQWLKNKCKLVYSDMHISLEQIWLTFEVKSWLFGY